MNRDLKEFINEIENETKRNDCKALVQLMEKESGYKANLHGKIVGFGLYHYKYDSGREGDAIVTGFSPRSQNISIYIMPGFSDYKKELESIGKYKTGKSCLYIKKLIRRVVIFQILFVINLTEITNLNWMQQKVPGLL